MSDDYYIGKKKVSSSEDFLNFLFDAYISSFNIKESLYEIFELYDNKKSGIFVHLFIIVKRFGSQFLKEN